MVFYGAGDEARTRYLHLGKVALYRMSYTRIGNIAHYSGFFENVKGEICFFDKIFSNGFWRILRWGGGLQVLGGITAETGFGGTPKGIVSISAPSGGRKEGAPPSSRRRRRSSAPHFIIRVPSDAKRKADIPNGISAVLLPG